MQKLKLHNKIPESWNALVAEGMEVCCGDTASTTGHHKSELKAMKTASAKRAVEEVEEVEEGEHSKQPSKQPRPSEPDSDIASWFAIARENTAYVCTRSSQVASAVKDKQSGIVKLARAEFLQAVVDQLHIDVLFKIRGLKGKFQAKVLRMVFRRERSKAIFQIVRPDKKAICQSQCHQPGNIQSTLLRAKVIMWVALSGADKESVIKAKHLIEA